MNRPVLMRLVAACVIVAIIASGCAAARRRPAPAPATRMGEFMRGVNYVGYSADVFSSGISDRLLGQLAGTGTTWVAISPVWFQENARATAIERWEGRTPTDASLRHAIRKAHDLGMKVMLRPLVDSKDGAWRATFFPEDWGRWFDSYRRFITHYARLARQEKVEAFVVGGEFNSSDVFRDGDWRAVIDAVRREFGGPLTYAADWRQYRNIRFWDKLDYIGIDAYFPLTDKPDPTLADLEAGWRRHSADIDGWRSRNFKGKKVVFTEIGYLSRRGAAQDPLRYDPTAPIDLGAQRDAYEATYRTVYQEPWLAGLFWFWWDNPTVADWPGGRKNGGYTPRGKPAEDVLRSWNRRLRPVRGTPPSGGRVPAAAADVARRQRRAGRTSSRRSSHIFWNISRKMG